MTSEAGHKGYDPAFFKLLYEVEDKHFWFLSRNRVIAAVVKRLASRLTASPWLLEVGCGTGNVLRVLEQACPNGTVIGMDLFAEGLAVAHCRTTAALVQGDMHRPPLANRFEVIGLFDVLEHVPDDCEVLSEVRRMLVQDGALVLTVPAHPVLWSYFDEASRHCRRYHPEELKRKLIETGYEAEYITQYMFSILPLVWIGRHLAALRGRAKWRKNSRTTELAAQELRPIPVLNEVLSLLLSVEGRWLGRGGTLPLGTSLVAVARKRG